MQLCRPLKSRVFYQRSNDGVEENRPKLVEERSCRHEVRSFHDDRRQNDGEKELRVELDDLVVIAGEERYDSEYDADHDQQAALWNSFLQRLARMKRWKQQRRGLFTTPHHSSRYGMSRD